jgi:hypothetical protein
MTALDTTNLRLAITVPAHGIVRFRLAGVIHGATTFPSILLGVLNGATVVGRVAPVQSLGNTAVATALVSVEAEFTATGLTPGAMNVDAAYGVETVVAATGIKYGGPNNTTGNDAFGGFVFEAWDPQPLKAALDGGVNVTQFGGTAGTFAAGRPEVNTSHAAGTAWASGAITAAVIATDAIGAAEFAQGAADKVWATAARLLTAGTNIVLAKGTGVTGFNDLDAAGMRAAAGLASANLDTQLSTIAGYLDTEVAAILAAVDTEVAAIKAKTDNLPANPAAAGDQMALTAAAVDAILDDAVEGSNTVRQLLRGFAAALLGKASGLNLNAPKFRDLGDTKDRISATTDTAGNRTAVTLDLS